MAYATQADMEDRFGTAELVKLTDRGDPPAGQIDAEVLARAIADAEAEINGYLASRYTLPLATVPAVLGRITCDLARYYLYDDWTNEPVRSRYEDSVRLLKGISEGKVALGIDPEAQDPVTPAGAASTTAAIRVFTRDTMRGF